MLAEQRNPLLRIVAYIVILSALMLVVIADANSAGAKFFEDSLTERSQEALLLLAALGMLFMASRLQHVSTLALAFAGFFMVSFIRELDALLEQNIGTGTWQVLVTIVLLAVFYRLRVNWSGFKNQLSGHLESYSFGLFIAGFLTTYIFSRLIGNEELWLAILEENYRRSAKNAVEESVELLGYALLLFSVVEFYCRHAISGRAESQAS